MDQYENAIAKYTAFFMTIIAKSILSFAYVEVVCHILNVKFSSLYLAYILAVIPYMAVSAYYISYRISLRIYKGVDYIE